MSKHAAQRLATRMIEDLDDEVEALPPGELIIVQIRLGGDTKVCEVFSSLTYAIDYLYDWCVWRSRRLGPDVPARVETTEEKKAYVLHHFRYNEPSAKYSVFGRQLNPRQQDDNTYSRTYLEPNEWE